MGCKSQPASLGAKGGEGEEGEDCVQITSFEQHNIAC